jgi:hypothetical protein
MNAPSTADLIPRHEVGLHALSIGELHCRALKKDWHLATHIDQRAPFASHDIDLATNRGRPSRDHRRVRPQVEQLENRLGRGRTKWLETVEKRVIGLPFQERPVDEEHALGCGCGRYHVERQGPYLLMGDQARRGTRACAPRDVVAPRSHLGGTPPCNRARRGTVRSTLLSSDATRNDRTDDMPPDEPSEAEAKAASTGSSATPARPRRDIVHAEALGWLAGHAAEADSSVITSLPDVSEMPHVGFDGWRDWFKEAARRVIQWLPADGVAIFFQSDIRHRGAWIDKGYLVLSAVEAEGAHLVWHKIVCRHAPGTVTHGRASYSHMLCVSAKPRMAPKSPGPDVLPDAGFMPWSKAMGVNACRLACRYLRDETSTRTVVDPFCGSGTALAVANSLGFDAIGVDLSARRCRAARRLEIE